MFVMCSYFIGFVILELGNSSKERIGGIFVVEWNLG